MYLEEVEFYQVGSIARFVDESDTIKPVARSTTLLDVGSNLCTTATELPLPATEGASAQVSGAASVTHFRSIDDQGSCDVQTRVSGSNEMKTTFPVKLYRALLDAKARGLTDVCSFMPSGATFRIHDPNRFMEEIAPQYFRQTKYMSFLRQLQLYEFTRVVEAHTVDCYAHKYFQESRPELLPNVRRKQQSNRKQPPSS